MSDDKPFEAQPTTLSINPGGRLTTQVGSAEPVSPAVQSASAKALRPLLLMPLSSFTGVADVMPFLVLAIRIRIGQVNDDPARLLGSVQNEIARVFGALGQRGWEAREAHLAKFFVCCAVDNAALNSPLARYWAGNQLSSTFFKTALGGEQFFNNVDAMLNARPGARPPLRLFELAYLCLVCGFEGRYGMVRSPQEADIDAVKKRLLAVIGEGGAVAAPSFLGTGIPKMDAAVKRSWRLPLWPVAACVVAACLALVFGYRALLGSTTEAALAQLQAGAAHPLGELNTPAPVWQPQAAWLERLRAEASQAGFEVVQTGAQIRVVGSGGLFASASDRLREDLVPAYTRIGALLNEDGGRGMVIVRGHTDRQPIRSLQFQSNRDLSRARAKAVGTVVASALTDASRVYIEAVGDSEPVCQEMTKDCLARNRRVELVLDPTR